MHEYFEGGGIEEEPAGQILDETRRGRGREKKGA
jgi:hypothetical protein